MRCDAVIASTGPLISSLGSTPVALAKASTSARSTSATVSRCDTGDWAILATSFAGGRHQRRVDKIADIERDLGLRPARGALR